MTKGLPDGLIEGNIDHMTGPELRCWHKMLHLSLHSQFPALTQELLKWSSIVRLGIDRMG